jgi:hypothetical protein
LADKSSQLIVEALTRATAEPSGLPLYGSSKRPGLFAGTVAARQAAGLCKEEEYLRVVNLENSGKATHEICIITEKGLAYLLDHATPKKVLYQIAQTLQSYETEVARLTEVTRKWHDGIEMLRRNVEQVLQQIQKPSAAGAAFSANGSTPWVTSIIEFLVEWRNSPHASDCPLPNVYRRAESSSPGLTIGHFHDGIRRLHEEQKIYLHPWTGPLYELPEPAFALLVGHEVAYYASMR